VVDTAAHTILKRAVLVVLEVVALVVLVLVVPVALETLHQLLHRKVITAAQWLELLVIPMRRVVVGPVQLGVLVLEALEAMVLLRQYQVRQSLTQAAVVVVEIVLRGQVEPVVVAQVEPVLSE
jgi:hypothetical protein